ncbi:coenzyme F420-0:L-glutamate ligase [Streptomyces radiopugnans]|nr:coenzyme F420-0:L-glutamate ligase [Streptomyces radiopugnans]
MGLHSSSATLSKVPAPSRSARTIIPPCPYTPVSGYRDRGWLLPADSDASARSLRDALSTYSGAAVAVVIADSDGRADRRGAAVISIGAVGVVPLRVTEHGGKRQEETFTDLVAAAVGIILGQRGRRAPVAVLRGIAYETSDEGVAAVLHHRP